MNVPLFAFAVQQNITLKMMIHCPVGLKNPPAMWETWVKSLGREDPLEEGMATHSSILCLENPRGRGAWRATVRGVAESDMTEQVSTARHRAARATFVSISRFISTFI